MTTDSLPNRMRRARQRLHLTQEQVEARTGIDASSLSLFENGKRQPSLAQLDRLARLYRRSVSWFLGADDTEDDVVLWRDRPEPEVAADVGAEFLRRCERYRDLEVWCGERSGGELSVPKLPERDAFARRDVVRLAKHVRDDLQLGDRPSGGLASALEEVCGVKVFHHAFEPTGTAACARSEAFGAAVLLNLGNAPWRRAFDLAHELFHLLTWEVFRPGWTGEPLVATDGEEQFANIFAENLLMPEEPFQLAVLRRMDEPDPTRTDQVYGLAREFGVSVPAVLTRMGFLWPIDPGLVQEGKAAWARSRHVHEDREVPSPPELPQRYTALALTALERGEVSIGRFAEYMGISRYRAMGIARSQGGDGEEVDPAAPA